MNNLEILKKYLGENLNIKKIEENNYVILDGNTAIAMEIKDLKEIELNEELNIVSNTYSHWESRRNGVLNKSGNIVVEFKYKDIYRWKDFFIVRDLSDKCGVLNSTGDIVVPFKYNDLSSAGEYLIAQNKLNKYGLINIKEEVLIDFIYDKITKTIDDLLIVSIDEKEGVINYKGNIIIPIVYYSICFISNSLFKIERRESYRWDFETKYRYYKGIFDKNGNEIVPVNCWDITNFKDELAIFKVEGNSEVSEDSRCGIINKNGKILIDNYYFLNILDNGLIHAISNDNKHGLLNLKAEVILPVVFDKIDKFKDGLAGIHIHGKHGIINNECKFVEPLK